MKPLFKIYGLIVSFLCLLISCDNSSNNSNNNNNPNSFNLLYVNNNASNVILTPSLSWQNATDPDGDTVKYTLLIDKTTDLENDELPTTIVATDLNTNFFTLTTSLLFETNYKWYVIATDGNGGSTASSNVFTFTTAPEDFVNHAPNPFSLLSPANGAVDVDLKPVLSWQSTNDPDMDNVFYDIYFGVNAQTATMIGQGFTNPLTSYVFQNNLATNTTYYWYVVAYDVFGATQMSATFSFTTGNGSSPNGTITLINSNAISSQQGRFGHQMVNYNGKLWILGGRVLENGSGFESNDVWNSSDDGTTWIQVKPNTPESSTSFKRSQEHQAVVFNNEMWVLDGNGNTAHKSTDGITWSTVPFSGAVADNTHYAPRNQHQAVVFNNRLWIIGGNAGGILQSDVWSTDGALNANNEVTWTQNKPNDDSAFSARTGHQVVAFKNKLWLIGGSPQGTAELNDVWSSSDGSNWNLVTNNAPFTTRTEHVCVVQNNGERLWLIGGDGLNPNNTNIADSLNDIWYTDDGQNWVLYKQHVSDDTSGEVFKGREEFDAVATSNAIIVTMGKNNTTFLNDSYKINTQ